MAFLPGTASSELEDQSPKRNVAAEKERDLLVLAGTDAAGRDLGVMLVNNADEVRTVLVRVPGAGTKALSIYRYFENDRPAGDDGVPQPKEKRTESDLEKGASFTLPSRGVLFLATREPLHTEAEPVR